MRFTQRTPPNSTPNPLLTLLRYVNCRQNLPVCGGKEWKMEEAYNRGEAPKKKSAKKRKKRESAKKALKSVKEMAEKGLRQKITRATHSGTNFPQLCPFLTKFHHKFTSYLQNYAKN